MRGVGCQAILQHQTTKHCKYRWSKHSKLQQVQSETPHPPPHTPSFFPCHSPGQVAGLPPVTKEWFEARKAQLTSAAASPHTKVWYDPLTKKKFQTQQTYQVGRHTAGTQQALF